VMVRPNSEPKRISRAVAVMVDLIPSSVP